MVEKPNVVWITLDSVRADHTSMGGYERDTTPRVEQIAMMEEGQYAPLCFSSSNGTPISSASILSGTHPSRHGLRFDNDYFPDELRTMPELMSDAGYTTACLSRNAYVSSGTGLDRGFDRFSLLTSDSLISEAPMKTLCKYVLNIRRHSAGITTDTAKHATPFLMNDILKQWVSELQHESPFLIYAHYNEPHRPYYPPRSYLDWAAEYVDMSPRKAADLALDIHHRVEEVISDGYTLTEHEEKALMAMYDAEIAYTDECIGRLFDHIQTLNLGSTIFIITADHGELFGEKGLLSHKIVLDDAVTHVPLVAHGFDGVKLPTNRPVGHVDVVRTIVEIADGPTEQCQGIDLRSDTRQWAVSQRPKEDLDRYRIQNDGSKFHRESLTSFRDSRFRYCYSDDMQALYRIPDEITDISDEHPGLTDERRQEVSDFLKSDGETVASERKGKLTNAMQKQLRDLGYVE